MLKMFLNILICVVFIGCFNLDRNTEWKDSRKIANSMEKLRIGDIIIKKRILTSPVSWFGHTGVMVSGYQVGEYPKIGIGYNEVNIDLWLSENREIAILRYRNFDEKLKKVFFEKIKKYNNKSYGIFTNKKNINTFYCSKFIWVIYRESIEELGYDIKIFNEIKGYFIFPYDFFKFDDFEKVDF